MWNKTERKMDMVKRLQEILDEAVEKKEIAGANLLVEKGGGVLCCLQSGYADLENKKEVKQDSIFRLYSMTKPVTATAAMKLVEQGKLDLGETVSSFLPEFRGQAVVMEDGKRVPAQREVVVKDLLNMTAGLMYPGYEGPAGRAVDHLFEELEQRLLTDHPMTTEEVAKRLGQCPLAFQPGSAWLYSSCADVLGAVIGKAAGMSFGAYLQQALLAPLGMEDTGFYVPEEKRSRLAVTYETAGDGLEPYRGNHLGIINAMNRKPAFESGGAGLVSTVTDYMKFAHMLLQGGVYGNERILEEKTVNFLTNGGLLPNQQKDFERNIPHFSGCTYGNLMRVMREEGKAYHMGGLGEYGWDGWLGCFFSNDPENRLSIVFMTQRRDAGTLPVMRKLKNVIYAKLGSLHN